MNQEVYELVALYKQTHGMRSEEAFWLAKKVSHFDSCARLMNKAVGKRQYTAFDAHHLWIELTHPKGRIANATGVDEKTIRFGIQVICDFLKNETGPHEDITRAFWNYHLTNIFPDAQKRQRGLDALERYKKMFAIESHHPIVPGLDCGLYNITGDAAQGYDLTKAYENVYELPFIRASREGTLHKNEVEEQILVSYLDSKAIFGWGKEALEAALEEIDVELLYLTIDKKESEYTDSRDTSHLLMRLKHLLKGSKPNSKKHLNTDEESLIFEVFFFEESFITASDTHKELERLRCVLLIRYYEYLQRNINKRIAKL